VARTYLDGELDVLVHPSTPLAASAATSSSGGVVAASAPAAPGGGGVRVAASLGHGSVIFMRESKVNGQNDCYWAEVILCGFLPIYRCQSTMTS